MAFQATTDIRKPLAVASKIAAKGNRIVLDEGPAYRSPSKMESI